MIEARQRARLRELLLHDLGVAPGAVRCEPIRAWRLSHVERLHLPRPLRRGHRSVVFKAALAPFLTEHEVLAEIGAQLPVPRLLAVRREADVLGMLLEDLGDPVRPSTQTDALAAALAVHATSVPLGLAVLDSPQLAGLPGRARGLWRRLCAAGRYPDTEDLDQLLAGLEWVAASRARGARLRPFGMCHGELHPSAVHIGTRAWRVLDFAMAFRGPGLLDLASWPGLGSPADPAATRTLIRAYVAAGGHPEALADRGGLPAERWALGWHRVHAAHWHLHCAATGIDGPDTDPHTIEVLRRQLGGAVDLLAAPSERTDIHVTRGAVAITAGAGGTPRLPNPVTSPLGVIPR